MFHYPKFRDAYIALPHSLRFMLCADILGEDASEDSRIMVNEAAIICEEIWRGNVGDDYLSQFFSDETFSDEV